MKVNLKNIQNFIEGNYRFFKNKFLQSPEYINEQINYRLFICKDTCLVEGTCQNCTCPARKKVWNTTSCNDGRLFPDLMNKEDWEAFKQKNKIDIKND